ncbi:MAG: hypothetical protein AABW52_02785 [Nanoarchaeota archaeon]
MGKQYWRTEHTIPIPSKRSRRYNFNNINYALKDKTYIIFNPSEDKQTDQDLQRARALLLTIKPQVYFGCSEEEGCDDLPLIDCKTEKNSAIYFKQADENKVSIQDNCLVLEYKKVEKNRLIERLYYNKAGIMR